MLSPFLAGIQRRFPVRSAGSGGLHSACGSDCPEGGQLLASRRRLERSRASADGFYSRFSRARRAGKKSGGKVLFPTGSGGEAAVKSRSQLTGGTVAAGALPDGTSASTRTPTHPGHVASGFGPAWEMEIRAQAMSRPPRVLLPAVAEMLAVSWRRRFPRAGKGACGIFPACPTLPPLGVKKGQWKGTFSL